MSKDLIEALREAFTENTRGHAAVRLPQGGTGCSLHPVCESCPFDDCTAKETDILRWDRRMEARRERGRQRAAE